MSQWERKFAILPTKLDDGSIAWLRWVEMEVVCQFANGQRGYHRRRLSRSETAKGDDNG